MYKRFLAAGVALVLGASCLAAFADELSVPDESIVPVLDDVGESPAEDAEDSIPSDSGSVLPDPFQVALPREETVSEEVSESPSETNASVSVQSEQNVNTSSQSVEESSAPSFTLWNKPFDEYTPTEGYLFLLVAGGMTVILYKIFRKGIL